MRKIWKSCISPNLISNFCSGDCFSKVVFVCFFTSSDKVSQSAKWLTEYLNHSVIHLTHIYSDSDTGSFKACKVAGKKKEQDRASAYIYWGK